jgi:RHS repeat-associated protein
MKQANMSAFIATRTASRSEDSCGSKGSAPLLAALALSVLTFWASPARAQSYLTQTGTPAFTTAQPVELGFINLGNGNLHLTIPLGSFPQRGARPFTTLLVYDSRIWQTAGATWQPTNAGSQGGWRRITSTDTGGGVSNTTTIETCNSDPPLHHYYDYYGFTWTSPDGVVHNFPTVETIHDTSVGNMCGGSFPTSNGFADDATGYQMFVTNYTSATVYAPDGTQVYPAGMLDTNGNYFSWDANGNLIDTLGRTPVTYVANGAGCTASYCYNILNSQGSTSQVKVTTQTISVSTSFGQLGLTEYSGTITVIQSIQLPDNTTYQFSYDSGTAAGHYGELTGITLPTLGQITYGYTNFTDAFGTHNMWATSRVSGGGTWSYTPSVTTGCNPGALACQQVTVTKPSTDNVVYTFSLNDGAWKSQVQSYTGAALPANLVASSASTWDFSQPCSPLPCTGASHVRILRTTTTLPTPGSNSVSSKTEMTYADANTPNLASIKEWKFYAGASPTFPTTPDRETDITYLATSPYTAKNIRNRPLSIIVKNSAGTQVALTNLTYDGGTLTSVTGVTHHDDAGFGTGNTTRGNVTQIKRCTVLSSCSGYLATTLTYDTTGQARSVQDPALHTFTLSYADSFFTDNGVTPPAAFTPTAPTNAYLTQATLPASGTINLGYYFNTGKRTLVRDQNGNDSYNHFQDPLDRLTLTLGPLLSGSRPWTLTSYATTETQADAYTGIADTSPSSGCTSCRHDQLILDNSGRATTQTLVSDPEGATTVTTNYDATSRVLSNTHPFRGIGDPTYGLETPAYDGLDRVIKITHPDNTSSQLFYGAAVTGTGLGGVSSQLCSSTTVGLGYPVLGMDEAGKKRQTWTDGFGRTIEVEEPDSNGNLTLVTCHLYDAIGNLTCTVQKGTDTTAFTSCASAPAAWRPRSNVYDALSRSTSATVPETGNTTSSHTTNFYYTTSTGGLCSGDPRAICRITDPRAITKTYAFDVLNRLASLTYSDTTPSVTYSYDQTTYNGLAITNGKGRETGMSDGSGTTAWSYDAAGRVITEKRTIAGITKTISYSYNLDGSPATITYPSGKQVAYTVSNAQRATSAKDVASGTQYAITASYAAPGTLQGVITGKITGGFGGVTESRSYNNRLEYTGTQATSSAGTALNLSYNYNLPGGNNGSPASVTNNIDNGRTESLQYDPLNRIVAGASQATSGVDCWGQSYGPQTNPVGNPPQPPDDAWSNLTQINLTQCSGNQLSASVNTSNQINTSSSYAYDAAGNMTQDGSGFTYSFDAENRIASAAGVSYSYDGNGLRVKKSNGTLYWRSIFGDSIAESDLSGNITSEYVFFAGRRIARMDSGGNVFYYFADPLGTTRTITQSNGTVCYDADFTPYGQEMVHTNTCPQNYKYTGYERDPETGLDYAMFRYYSPRLGRFMSVDPLPGDVQDPQSFNRYAYVLNNPVGFIDPLGLCSTDPVTGKEVACIKVDVWVHIDDGPHFTDVPGICTVVYRNGWLVSSSNGCSPNPIGSGATSKQDRGGGGNSGGNSSPSPTWVAIKTFFTPPSTGPGSCTAVFLNSIQNSGGNALRTTATNLQKYGQAAASGLARAGPQAEGTIAAMVAGGQLSPAVGAVATNIVTGTAPLAAAAAPYVVTVGGYAVLAGLDVLLFKGVADELSAALKGQCKP